MPTWSLICILMRDRLHFFGTIAHVPDWDDTHAMSLQARSQSQRGKWIRNDSGVRAFQGLGKNSPSREQAVRRITRGLPTHLLIESLDYDLDPWGKWWRITLAVLRLAWRRRYFGVSGNQLKVVKAQAKKP